jgi:serine phosphatase RsbU (regulator of sigma subunit)
MDFCNAGHNPPIFNGEFMEMETNAPIGLWPDLDFVGEHVDNIKGHPLFIYSDGLNEAENRQQEQFGDERLLQILRDNHFDSAQQVIEFLCNEVEAHRNGAAPNDDLTMMTLKVD